MLTYADVCVPELLAEDARMHAHISHHAPAGPVRFYATVTPPLAFHTQQLLQLQQQQRHPRLCWRHPRRRQRAQHRLISVRWKKKEKKASQVSEFVLLLVYQ
jgi:hypothetical protein